MKDVLQVAKQKSPKVEKITIKKSAFMSQYVSDTHCLNNVFDGVHENQLLLHELLPRSSSFFCQDIRLVMSISRLPGFSLFLGAAVNRR